MKKIGIMSMQRIVNYGSFMQAYSLKKIIESLGYCVEFVDYKYEGPIINAKKDSIFKKIKRNLDFVEYFGVKNNQRKMTSNYTLNIKKYLNIDEKKNYAYNDIDQLVIGSDEVFNCLQGYPVGYSRELFGKNYESIPVISYAGSFGSVTLERIKESKIDEEIAGLLSKFKAISVRDENSYSIIKKLTGKNPIINMDPVIINDLSKDMKDIDVNINNYILIYAYPRRLTKDECKYIKRFAKKHNKKIVTIGGYQKIADYNLVIDPFEMFAYFKNADFVITDTFHGTIFSIKTHAKFATIVRNGKLGNNNKVYDLLKRVKLTDRVIDRIERIEELSDKTIDYKATDEIMDEEKRKTLDYLEKNLK